MTPAITLDELLAWSCQSSNFWKAHLDANPALLALPCGIGGATDVQALVRHIWAVDLLWSQRIAGLPQVDRNTLPTGPLDALYAFHLEAVGNFRRLLENPAIDWNEGVPLDSPWLPPEARRPSRRKLLTHALLHSQRHWAQLATLVRAAGFPSGFMGDFLLNSALQ